MLPISYQNCLEKQLKRAEYLTLVMLVFLLQSHKQVSIEALATAMEYPILFESRRRSIQRFLKLPSLKAEKLWFPLVKYILRTKFKHKQELMVALDRTQWRDRNIFVISLIWDKRSIPLYWQILSKEGCSNLKEQKRLIRPILGLLKKYEIIILGDREFGSVKLAKWLRDKKVKFVLRIQKGRYMQKEGEEFKKLSEGGLKPGMSLYWSGIKVTKQKGFGEFDIAGYWKREYRNKGEEEGWYLLTNVGTVKEAVKAYKHRSGIEAMFKDCKTGGYNLEKSHASEERLEKIILLIAIAYSSAILQGREMKQKGVQKYIGRVKESGRRERRHSSFWIGIYGQGWVGETDCCQEIVEELMVIRRNKLPFFQRGMRAMMLIRQCL